MQTNKENQDKDKQLKEQLTKPEPSFEVPTALLNDTKELVAKAKKHIADIKEYLKQFHGKHNYNPYVWLKDIGITDAESFFEENDESARARLIAENVLKIQKTEPKIKVVKPLGFREFIQRNEEEKIEKERKRLGLT